jgi:hypothetical protein
MTDALAIDNPSINGMWAGGCGVSPHGIYIEKRTRLPAVPDTEGEESRANARWFALMAREADWFPQEKRDSWI